MTSSEMVFYQPGEGASKRSAVTAASWAYQGGPGISTRNPPLGLGEGSRARVGNRRPAGRLLALRDDSLPESTLDLGFNDQPPVNAIAMVGRQGAQRIRPASAGPAAREPVLVQCCATRQGPSRWQTSFGGTSIVASVSPNFDYNERSTVVMFGGFGNRVDPGMSGAR